MIVAAYLLPIQAMPFRLNLKHRVLKEIPITRTTGKPHNGEHTHLLPDLSGVLVYGFVPEIEVWSLNGEKLPSIYLYNIHAWIHQGHESQNWMFELRRSFAWSVASRSPSVVSLLRTFDGIHFWYVIENDSVGGTYEFGQASLEGPTWRIAVTPERYLGPGKVPGWADIWSVYEGAFITGGIDQTGKHPVIVRVANDQYKKARPFGGQLPVMKAPFEFKVGSFYKGNPYSGFSWGSFLPLRFPSRIRDTSPVSDYDHESRRLLHLSGVYDARDGSLIARSIGHRDAFFIDRGQRIVYPQFDPPGTYVFDIKTKETVLVSTWGLVARTANARFALFESPGSTAQRLVDLRPDEPLPSELKIP